MALFNLFKRGSGSAPSATETPRKTPRKWRLGRSGRRFVHSTAYMLPKDRRETERLDFQHELLRRTFKGNYQAPVSNPASILDVGTGTGRWAIDLATVFPDARVIGFDKAPPIGADGVDVSQKQQTYLPPNFQFVEGNLFDGLPWPDNTFDFTHMRLLYLAIPARLWPWVVRELARVTRPGGWVELMDSSCDPHETRNGPAAQHLCQYICDAANHLGLDLQAAWRFEEFLRDAGLTNISLRDKWLPMGKAWGSKGIWLQRDIYEAAVGLTDKVVEAGVTTRAEYEAAIDAWNTQSARYHGGWPFRLAIAQKPAQ